MSQDRPSREVAWRLFAAEFDDADYSYAESDEERAPNYVVTPTGARVNRLFVVGVLTEVEQVSDDVLRARVVDPTGAFVVYAGQYQPDALAALERLDTPTFVAVTGKARTFEPDDADTVYTSVRPESISEVDAETRDRWVVRTAEQTLDRIGAMADALGRDVRGDDLREALVSAGVRPDLAAGIPVAIDHYGTTETYLDALRTVAVQAAEVVAGDREEVDVYTPAPDEGGPADADLAADLDVPETTDTQAAPEATTADSADVESVAEATESGSGDVDAGGEDAVEAASETDETEAASTEEPSDEDDAVAAESGSAVEGEPGAADAGDVGTTEELAESTAPEPEAVEPEPESVEPEVEEADEELGDFDAGSEESEEAVDEDATTAETDESAVETDEMYEFDEEERAEIEEEFDMDFSSGEDIPEAGEAGIDAEPEEPEASEDVADEASTADDTGADADAASFEGDLEDVVVDVMDDLDDGDGVARDEVVRTVVEEYDAETGDVEDAIQSALMSGRCYESGEDTLKAI